MMRVLSIIGGVLLLLLGICGVVCLVMGFKYVRGMLVDDVPIIITNIQRGTQIRVPGKVAGALAILLPLVFCLGGAWLLYPESHRKHKRDP